MVLPDEATMRAAMKPAARPNTAVKKSRYPKILSACSSVEMPTSNFDIGPHIGSRAYPQKMIIEAT